MARILRLSVDMLESMIANPDFQQFPCIATPPRKAVTKLKTVKSRGCGGCKRAKQERKVRARAHGAGPVDFNLLKQQILQLNKQDQAAIKELLNCTGLKIQYKAQRRGVERRVI